MATKMRIQTTLIVCLLLTALAHPALATWSIVVANTETGEVGIGSATCVADINLIRFCGVIVVGKGAASAQEWGDINGENRLKIFDGLLAGMTAPEILEYLKQTDPELNKHQYGIVDLMGGAGTWSSPSGSAWKGGLTGQVGPITYAIQGNVLTCADVVLAAEQALITADGDLSQRVMAAMHAAKLMGGDGRCSCAQSDPTGCGCPPDTFTHSSYVAYITIARIGDPDGDCNGSWGCALGPYYMKLNVKETDDNDPVDTLQGKYDQFRLDRVNHGDHLLSEKVIYPEEIDADGQSQAELLIALVDLEGLPVDHGGALVTVSHDPESAGATLIGPVTDLQDGTYSVMLTATNTPGQDLFRVKVEDGYKPVTLYPYPTLAVKALAVDQTETSVIQGSRVDLSLMGGEERAGRQYLVLGTASGTVPGFEYDNVQVPVNIDPFTHFMLGRTNTPTFSGALGSLDGLGRAVAVYDPKPFQLRSLLGKELSFSWVTLMPVDFASDPVSVQVVP